MENWGFTIAAMQYNIHTHSQTKNKQELIIYSESSVNRSTKSFSCRVESMW